MGAVDLDAIRPCRDRQDGSVRRDLLGVCSEHDWYWPEGRPRCNFFTGLEISALAEAERLRSAIARVEDLHHPWEGPPDLGFICAHCCGPGDVDEEVAYPCDTILALADLEPQPGEVPS